jgi:hypothetical protein
VNPASHAEEVKVAKRDMLRAIGNAKRSPKMPGPAVVPRLRPESTQKIATRVVQDNNARAAQFSNYRKIA